MLLEKLDYLSQGAELVVFAGSLPRDVDDDFYAEAIHDARPQEHSRPRSTATASRCGSGSRRSRLLVSPNQREAEARRRPRVPRRRGLRARPRPDRRRRRPQRDHHDRVGLLRPAPRGARGAALPGRRPARRAGVGRGLGRHAARCVHRRAQRRAAASRTSCAPLSQPAPPRRSSSAQAASTHATQAGSSRRSR